MASEKTRAIVIRLVEFSETSCVLTLFTEDFGKVSALAKGARRPKSAFEGALDLLALVRIVFLRKSSDALDLLTEAKLERRFRSAQRDLNRLYAGYYVAELLAELTDTGDPNRELFLAADQALLALDAGAGVPETILRWELEALRQAGHLPSLDACVVCGQPVTAAGRLPFGMAAGGVLCETCRPGRRGVVSMSATAANLLKHEIQRLETLEPAEPIAPEARGELRAVMASYLAHQIGHRLRMSDYLASQ